MWEVFACAGTFPGRVQSLPVTQSNVLESYKTVFKKEPPPELVDACNKAKPACN